MNLPEYESSVWPFLTIMAALMAAVLGALVGYGLTLWQNRLLPWITVHNFSTTTGTNEIVRLDPTLVAASEESWNAIPLASESRLSVVHSARNAATYFQSLNADSAATIDTALHRIGASTTLAEIRAACISCDSMAC